MAYGVDTVGTAADDAGAGTHDVDVLPAGASGTTVPSPPAVGGFASRVTARLRRAEIAILASASALVGLGLVMIYSTSGVLADRFGSPTHFLVRQGAWAAVGVGALFLARSVDYHVYVRNRKLVLVGTLALLALVLVPGIGTRLNGARRWFRFAGVGFQPSDLAKLGLSIYLASFLGQKHGQLDDWKRGFLPAALGVASVVALTAAEPDIGTAALLAAVGCGLLVVGGVRVKHLIPAAIMTLPVAACYVIVRFDYVRRRLMVFLDPSFDPLGSGYHVRQSLIALAQGGFWGEGLGRGSQKLFFLPEAHTDFILAIIGEELGLVAALAVVGAFAVIICAAFAIARDAPDRAGALLATGIALWIGLQAAFNIAVVTASVPTKGIPLPLVSYGGSALVVTACGLGVLMNIAGHGMNPPRRGVGGGPGGGWLREAEGVGT